MKKMTAFLKSVFLYAGLDRSFYPTAAKELRRFDRITAAVLSGVCAAVLLLSAAFSSQIGGPRGLGVFCLCGALFFGLILAVLLSAGRERPALLVSLVSLCTAAAFALGILRDTVLTPDKPAVLLPVLLLVLPQLVCARPVYSVPAAAAASATHIIAAYFLKPELFGADVFAVCCCCVCGLILGILTTVARARGCLAALRLRETEKQKSAALERAEKAEHAADLIGGVSRDIRTPLNTITDAAAALKNKFPASKKAAKYLDQITVSGKRIAVLLDTLPGAGETGSEAQTPAPTDLRPKTPSQTPAASSPAVLLEKAVLVVDDNEINREMSVAVLEEYGVPSDTADDGSTAVEKIRHARVGQYRLILMDIQMPVMDGCEAARQIRAMEDPLIASLPIVALTACESPEDMEKARQVGMNDYLIKPLDVEKLKFILGRYLI